MIADQSFMYYFSLTTHSVIAYVLKFFKGLQRLNHSTSIFKYVYMVRSVSF